MRVLYAVFLLVITQIIVLLAVAPAMYWVGRMGAPISYLQRTVLAAGLLPLMLTGVWWIICGIHRYMTWPQPGHFVSPRRHAGDRLLLASALLLVPAVTTLAALSSPYTDSTADLRWQLLPASLWSVGWLAFAEEFLYRRILLGELLRIADQRIHWCLLALFAQAVVFALFHGKSALISTQHFLFYFLGGAILGWIYWIHQNIWLNAFIHMSMNVSVAQVGPTSRWFAGRIAQFTGDHWHGWFLAGSCLLLMAALGTLPFRKTKGRETSRPWYGQVNG
ncbi:MAG: CPBP family intramembrane metalloprotease [Mitsuaria chitosanitabida]|uniref:CPBP family intramembrane glutamic endopeptidase n=1 Tax=Roseateles chitosanitabidus TaxID=65048 RepID=UPI001B15DD07|nr:type II CAAX endopeptidase family protein [Roseateles chitosanitabidus]MBO9689496.1 CPBP family intramembrane metalloprotease [Roseateles chitosanitabidus]